MDQLEATLLFANDTFYVAFTAGDIETMDALWAQDAPISCIHPGGPVLTGHEIVMESWHTILGSGQTEGISCFEATAMISGDTGWVTCMERIGDNILAATNLFIRKDGAWKMVHHQSGLTPGAPPPPEPEAPQAN